MCSISRICPRPLNIIQNKYTNFSTKTSEEFNTASRSVKPGLIAAGIGKHLHSNQHMFTDMFKYWAFEFIKTSAEHL
jgi:hypothetical protein